MIISLSSLNPKVAELIESNNQQETRLNMFSSELGKLRVEMQSLKDENQRRKSMEF